MAAAAGETPTIQGIFGAELPEGRSQKDEVEKRRTPSRSVEHWTAIPCEIQKRGQAFA
jgi:hypothetical protein